MLDHTRLTASRAEKAIHGTFIHMDNHYCKVHLSLHRCDSSCFEDCMLIKSCLLLVWDRPYVSLQGLCC
ncbi:hypothetical protein GDO86_003211 [Hymenochirus boettgeri]|uniref:Uncharacterized protein n=1 Tax=Hymenochirus boettgeri TaxID=247094 RepID=A0A8T2K657_9PIPI|nr:hypothetical protein GDO86_003211 [Hymenochirus boettgeri]